MNLRRPSRDFFARKTVEVARDLLGLHLVHAISGRRKVGRITEVEAYIGTHDLASHSSRGLTPRTCTMFGPPGHAYVYLIYGMHHCFNVVTEPEGHGCAVLVRAVENVEGLDGHAPGPGLVCRKMGITRAHDGMDLLGHALCIECPAVIRPVRIQKGPRIGVEYAGRWARRHLRFLDSDAVVSRPIPALSRRSLRR